MFIDLIKRLKLKIFFQLSKFSTTKKSKKIFQSKIIFKQFTKSINATKKKLFAVSFRHQLTRKSFAISYFQQTRKLFAIVQYRRRKTFINRN